MSGIAGPDGGVPGKPVGTVWFAAAVRRGEEVVLKASRQLFERDREAVRRRSVEYALEMILQLGLPHAGCRRSNGSACPSQGEPAGWPPAANQG